jgi:uncharacterized cupredoxin-like copper-binding protein
MSKKRWNVAAVAVTAMLAISAAACAGDEGSGGGGNTVDLSLKDFELTVSPDRVSAGDVTFRASNDGPSTHEFEVFSGADGVDVDSLPVEAGVANTDGLTLIDEVEDITPGATQELTVDLDAGAYALVCNLPAHYEQGMRATFTVA